MKNFIYILTFSILAVSRVFSQSILLTPTQMNSNQTTNDQIILKGTTAPIIAGVRFSGSLATPSATTVGSAPLTLDGRGYDGTNFTIGRGKIIFGATENWTSTANGTSIQFWTTANGTISTTEKMRIGNDGNVGIGTDTPLATLEVARGTGQNGTAAFQGTTNTSHFNYSTAENTYIRGGKVTSNVVIGDVSGNVAIGNGVPLDKLHVFGNIRSSNLAGTGIRNVTADASGILSAATITKYYSAPFFSFVKLSNDATTANYFGGVAYLNSGTGILRCPLYLPNGAKLLNARVYYNDFDATNDLSFNFISVSHATGISFGGTTVSSSGIISGNLLLDIPLLSSVDNQNNSYYFQVSQKSGGSVWTNSLGVVSVVITYTE